MQVFLARGFLVLATPAPVFLVAVLAGWPAGALRLMDGVVSTVWKTRGRALPVCERRPSRTMAAALMSLGGGGSGGGGGWGSRFVLISGGGLRESEEAILMMHRDGLRDAVGVNATGEKEEESGSGKWVLGEGDDAMRRTDQVSRRLMERRQL